MPAVAALTAASTALSIGGAVANHAQQASLFRQNRLNAVRAYEADTSAITARQIQEQDAAAQQSFQEQREYDATRSRAVVAADQAGIRGISVDALLNDLAGQRHRQADTGVQNLSMKLEQLQREKLGAAASRDNAIASVTKPSGLGLALQIGGQVASGVEKYRARTKPNGS